MNVDSSAAHKRIRMEMMKHNSNANMSAGFVGESRKLSTISREQAMQIRKKIDPECKELSCAPDSSMLAASTTVRSASVVETSTFEAPKKPRSISTNAFGGWRKNSKKPVGTQDFASVPVLCVNVKRSSPSVQEEQPKNSKRSSVPLELEKKVTVVKPALRKSSLAVTGSSASNSESKQVKPQMAKVNYASLYSLGEVVLFTLSGGRKLHGEIICIQGDKLIVEYLEGQEEDTLFRALIKAPRYDPESEELVDELQSIMETQTLV